MYVKVVTDSKKIQFFRAITIHIRFYLDRVFDPNWPHVGLDRALILAEPVLSLSWRRTSILSWLLVVYIPCHFFSGQLLFTLRAPKNQLRKNLVRLTRAMITITYLHIKHMSNGELHLLRCKILHFDIYSTHTRPILAQIFANSLHLQNISPC